MCSFLLILAALLFSDLRLFAETGRLLKKNPVLFIVFFSFSLPGPFVVCISFRFKWGSTEGFWVVLSAFLFFFLGAHAGSLKGGQYNTTLVKGLFFIGFTFVVLTTLKKNWFNGGVWGSMNDLTTAVLMATGGMAGLFLGDTRRGKDLLGVFLLLPFFAFAFYFSLRISTSDAALILLVGLFFFLAVLVPDWRAFSVTWGFFLLIVTAGIFLMIYSEPLNFKALLSTRKLESFLSFRPQGWLASLSLIRENPWIGIGSGLYKQFYEALLPLLPGKSVVLAHSHCLYLVHFVAHGAAAGIAFITLVVLNLRLVLSSLRKKDAVPFALMVAGIWFFALTYGLVELTPASREILFLLSGAVRACLRVCFMKFSASPAEILLKLEFGTASFLAILRKIAFRSYRQKCGPRLQMHQETSYWRTLTI